MHRTDLEHIIAAAANVVGQDDFVVIGSQAILATYPNAPAGMLASIEADIYPRDEPARAEQLDGALGDGSQFHRAYGFYAHGVGPETAKAPSGWEERLIPLEVPARVGSAQKPVAWCLEVHDLVLSKCAAGRERDWEYAREALAVGIVDAGVLLDRVPDLPLDGPHRDQIASILGGLIERLDHTDS